MNSQITLSNKYLSNERKVVFKNKKIIEGKLIYLNLRYLTPEIVQRKIKTGHFTKREIQNEDVNPIHPPVFAPVRIKSQS